MIRAGAVFLAVLFAGAGAAASDAAAWREVTVSAEPHQLRGDAEPHEALHIGSLVYRGGVHLTSDDDAFGGFSGLIVEADGSKLVAVSDRGQWLQADIVYDQTNRLAGLTAASMGAIVGPDGSAVSGRAADAESLARFDGRYFVSFEREHRIDAYRRNEEGSFIFDERVVYFGDEESPPYNEGIEAIDFVEGRLVVLSEAPFPDGANGYLIGPGGEREALGYRAPPRFAVTGAAEQGGVLYIVERAWSPLRGIRMRLARARLRDGDSVIEREELAHLGVLYAIDNFEGVAARADEEERLFLYVISDDNFSARQKTLLLMFEVMTE